MNPEEIEEERRLAYVGITRAERNYIFLMPLRVPYLDALAAILPSRFIDEIPEELVDGLRAKRKST